MRSSKCPRCGSEEIYVMYSFRDSQGNVIPLNDPVEGEETYYAKVDNYVCTTCRYTQSYIAEWEDIALIRQTWKRADGKRPRKRKQAPLVQKYPEINNYKLKPKRKRKNDEV